jgi:glycosyltransferase involved in cell wall biosynthesis
MRILNLIASLDPTHGGPAAGALDLAALWRRDGHEVDFVTLDALDAPYLDIGSRVIALGKFGVGAAAGVPSRFRDRFGYSPRLVPWLRRHGGDYDAVIVHSLFNYTTVAARRALVGGRTPYFVFPHGALDPWFAAANPRKHRLKTLLWRLVEGPVLNGAAAVLFTTGEEQALAARNGFKPWRITPAVVGFGANDASGDADTQERAFRAAVPALGDRRYFLFLSRLHEKKGCDLLIRAFADVAAEHPDLDLVMAGPDQGGLQDKLQSLAEALGIAARVHWAGMIRDDVKWGAYRGAEAFALTSHTENFGVVVAEALACALPVLITDKVNLWREVDADRAGLVEPDTVDGAVRLLRGFLTLDPSERAAMQDRARLCYERHFRMDGTADAIVTLMTEARSKP